MWDDVSQCIDKVASSTHWIWERECKPMCATLLVHFGHPHRDCDFHPPGSMRRSISSIALRANPQLAFQTDVTSLSALPTALSGCLYKYFCIKLMNTNDIIDGSVLFFVSETIDIT